MRIALLRFTIMLLPVICIAGEADIIDANVVAAGGDFYRFNVTVQHEDENWEHFAKAWEILDMNGNLLGVRILQHPHVNEQPFTRTLTVEIPGDVDQVTIRAYDLVHKFGGKELILKLDKVKQDDTK